jgi:hypothetical protein
LLRWFFSGAGFVLVAASILQPRKEVLFNDVRYFESDIFNPISSKEIGYSSDKQDRTKRTFLLGRGLWERPNFVAYKGILAIIDTCGHNLGSPRCDNRATPVISFSSVIGFNAAYIVCHSMCLYYFS